MQNQAAVEALYSATFVEDYIDCIENLPNELQRNFSRLREFDLMQHREFLSELESLIEAFEKDSSSLSSQRSTLLKIQQGLIVTQDIGDDKLATVQAISDTIENKSRQLEQDSKNLDFGRDEDDDSIKHETTSSKISNSNANGGTASSKSVKNKGCAVDDKSDKPAVKRRKKQQGQGDRSTKDERDENSVPSKGNGNGNGGGGGVMSSSANNVNKIRGSGKKPATKRKAAAKKTAANNDKDDSDREDLDVNLIDPDEPTYCLCDQVSYGEMIGCDNDLCPIEWFHFNCVQLSNKPKGKWYCPKCRGEKSTVMKPKAQFLKELEKYNKEREEKMMKQNG